MFDAIKTMLQRYNLIDSQSCNLALREIIQEIALLGLWRAKFFESAAFYGGTALRILYGLNRYSENLDFSLLKPNPVFSLDQYNLAITRELEAYGFVVQVDRRHKNIQSQIESAFIKANTKQEFIRIGMPDFSYKMLTPKAVMKIKLEVDVDPPNGFCTEPKVLLHPIPISINAYTASHLFAGKMHAVLCRLWKSRVKGRDWFDFVWFVQQGIALNLNHLSIRMQQSGHLSDNQILNEELFKKLLTNKINLLNIVKAKLDIKPFIKDSALIESWSQGYFHEITEKIKFD